MEIAAERNRSALRATAVGIAACLAIALPTLIAFNVSPSATFFNQAVAFVGWGVFLMMVGAVLPRHLWPTSFGARALAASLVVVVVAALWMSATSDVPWTLELSSAGAILAALLAGAVAAATARSIGSQAFRAFCIALAITGVLSSLIGLIQVFAPDLPDGNWIAASAIPGRATGNLRQPNHLSSLLLWSIIAVVWLGEAKVVYREVAAMLAVVFIYVIVLSASRTGAVGMLTLLAWGLLDRRLSRASRAILLAAPLIYLASWGGTSVWATYSHQLFGGQTRFGGSGDISSSRFGIWSNTLSLIAMHPWLGVGFGEFNFAWTLTPFPGRPVALFDHTHNLVLNFMVELGIPLALVVLGLMLFALWKALQNALADGRETPAGEAPFQRAAFVIVVMVAVHSMLEYPLWYAYFLLPTAFAFGLCLERPDPAAVAAAANPTPNVTRPFVIASMFLALGGALALYDYMRVAVIFTPPSNASPLEKRVEDGRRSILFGHHADYAAGTIAEHPGTVIDTFKRSPHFLLDARLMMAWAKALDERGEVDKARYVAARLKEFHNEAAEGFFAPCAAGAAASASAALPFQCLPPSRPLRFEDFR